MDINHDTTHSGPLGTLLCILTPIFVFLSECSADQIWTWSFRVLSAICTALAIYVNWDKAKEVFNKKRRKNGK